MYGANSQLMQPHYQYWAEEEEKKMVKDWIDYNC